MSNTQHSSVGLAKVITSSFLVAGATCVVAVGNQSTYAQEIQALSGQGSQISIEADGAQIEQVPGLQQRPVLHEAATARDLHSAAPGSGTVSIQILVGMLLILIGFCLHALFVLPAHHKPKFAQHNVYSSQHTQPVLRQLEVYWLERR